MKQMASKNYNNAFIFAYEPLVKEGKKWKRAKTPFLSPDKIKRHLILRNAPRAYCAKVSEKLNLLSQIRFHISLPKRIFERSNELRKVHRRFQTSKSE